MYAHVPCLYITWNTDWSLILTKFLTINECQYNVKLYHYKDHYPYHEAYRHTIKTQSIVIDAFHGNKTAQIIKFNSPKPSLILDWGKLQTVCSISESFEVAWPKKNTRKIFFDHWQKHNFFFFFFYGEVIALWAF